MVGGFSLFYGIKNDEIIDFFLKPKDTLKEILTEKKNSIQSFMNRIRRNFQSSHRQTCINDSLGFFCPKLEFSQSELPLHEFDRK